MNKQQMTISEGVAFLWHMLVEPDPGTMYRGQDVYMIYNDVLESAKAIEKENADLRDKVAKLEGRSREP